VGGSGEAGVLRLAGAEVARKTTRRRTIGERRGGEHGTGWGRHRGVPGGGSTGVVGFFLARFERGPTPERLGCDVRAPRYGRAQQAPSTGGVRVVVKHTDLILPGKEKEEF
jgi:hypothetical protein